MQGIATPGRSAGIGLQDGWITTGDMGYLDETGNLHVVGRADDVLVTGGVNVHPLSVEAALAACPGIGRVGVTGIEDPRWGVVLVAVYTGAASPETVDAWCRLHLTGAERPREFLPATELPTLGPGKLDRRGLRALAERGLRDRPIGR
jgi:O-succinylbenzoic acid--CoA ligase